MFKKNLCLFQSTNFANPVYEQFYDSRQTLLPKDDDSDDEHKGNGAV